MNLRPYAEKLLRWKRDPVAFVRECLKAEPDAWQIKVLGDVRASQRVAMKACKGPGKSCLMAWTVWWYLVTRKDSKVIATSITEDNLKDGLWSELKLWQNNSELLSHLFEWSAMRITARERPETWFASARKWAKDADKQQQANTLAGIHAGNVLFVLDEVSEYPDGVVAAAEGGLTTGPECKIIVAGNPTRMSGPLYRICTKDRALWAVTEITGDPDDIMRAPRIDINWARSQIEQWGRDSNIVRTNVLGLFPHAQSDTIIPSDVAVTAAAVTIPESQVTEFPRVLGVDCARFGDDRSVLFPRQGQIAYVPDTFRELSTMELAGRVAHYCEQWHPDVVFLDVGGMGAGVFDRLRELRFDYVIGVDSGSKPLRRGFVNRRAEMWVDCREWMRRGGSIPNDPQLIGELATPTYKFDSSGRITMESKADMKSRGVSSPDLADALALTFAGPAQRRTRLPFKKAQATQIGDYDPMDRYREEVA